MTDLSVLKSSEFGGNPLLSNSKLWKHSPIKNESEDNIADESSFCSLDSPNDEAEENLCMSPD